MSQSVKPLDLPLMESQLCVGMGQLPSQPHWLTQSYEDPRAFWQQLLATQEPLFPVRAKSVPFARYNFFHDAIVRNLKNEAPALCYYDGNLQRVQLSYRKLGERAARQAESWRLAGLEPGQSLCIIRPMGPELACAVLAALKLGAVLSILPPSGRSFLRRRLEALAPDFIDTDEAYRSLIPEHQELVLRTDSEPQADLSRSCSYPADSPVARLFDPCAAAPHLPRELTSDVAYLCALRDGKIALNLAQKRSYAAPGFHAQETLPALLLAGWLWGATFVHIQPEQLEQEPALLTAESLHAVGITALTRDLLIRRPLSIAEHWRYWFRNPGSSMELTTWQRFIDRVGAQTILAGNLKWNAALGGCTLFSARREGQASCHVWPAAGTPWTLANPANPELESTSNHGLLVQLPLATEGDPLPTASIIVGEHGEYVFAGAPAPMRRGRSYPLDEVLDALQGLPGAHGCAICPTPAAGGSTQFVLLVFVGGHGSPDEAELGQEIKRRIERELGRDFLPDSVRVLALSPRRSEEGEIDQAWCREQFLAGELQHQAGDPLYRTISLLREQVLS